MQRQERLGHASLDGTRAASSFPQVDAQPLMPLCVGVLKLCPPPSQTYILRIRAP